jgi:hypothetical protein
MSKYGFGAKIDLPARTKAGKSRPKITEDTIEQAVRAGSELGFVPRDPPPRLKPGPRRTEPQDKMTIPGPKRVIDNFRRFCQSRNMTLWQGIEHLLNSQKGRGD